MRTGQLLLTTVVIVGLQSATFAQASNRPPERRASPTVSGVLSVKSYAAVRSSLTYLAEVGGQVQLGQMLDGIITTFTGGHGLLGIDKKKPFGVAFMTYGAQDTRPLVFIPISDQEKALQLLHAVGPLIMRRFGPMPYKLTDRWFLIGPALDQLDEKSVPNPERLIDPGVVKYDVAFTSNVQEMPMVAVEDAFKRIDEIANSPFPGSKSLAFRQGQMAAAMTVKSLSQLMLSAKQITLGLNVSPKRKKVALELSLDTKRGSELHTMIQSLSRTPSQLAGLVDPAGLISCMVNAPLSARARGQLLAMMPSGEEPPDVLFSGTPKNVVTPEQNLISLLRKTVERGRIEFAFSLRGNPPGPLTLVGSAVLADSRSIERFLIKQIEVDQKTGRLEFAREVTRFKTIPIHEIRVPALDTSEKFFGRRPRIHFAATSNMLHVAFGGLSLESIRWAIDRTSGRRRYGNRFSPLVVQGRLQPWIALASDPAVKSLRRAVSPSERISLIVTPSSDSMKARFEVQEGLLRLLGSRAFSSISGVVK